MKQEFEETMKPGKKYKGYGVLNKYREFMFVPAKVGANEGQKQLVKQGEGWSVYTTRENVIVHLKMGRKDKMIERIAAFLSLQDHILGVLREYDLSKKTDTKKKGKKQ